MDYTEYKALYQKLVSESGRQDFGAIEAERQKAMTTMQTFLETFPKMQSPDRQPNTPWPRLSVRELFRRTIVAAIDIIQDFSQLMSERPYLGAVSFRRKALDIVARPERRLFVGFWLVFFSFVLYFIDSAA